MAKGIGPIGPGPQGRGGRKFDRRGAPDAFPGGPKDARPGDDFRGPERRGPRGFQRGFEDREGPPPPNFRGHGPMDPVQLFKAIDANGDGVIARDEFMEFHARMRPTEPPDQFRGEPRTMGRGPEGREGPPPRPHGARPGDDRCGPDGPDRRGPEGLDRGGPPWNDRPTELPR